jgi:hypothetical protein
MKAAQGRLGVHNIDMANWIFAGSLHHMNSTLSSLCSYLSLVALLVCDRLQFGTLYHNPSGRL